MVRDSGIGKAGIGGQGSEVRERQEAKAKAGVGDVGMVKKKSISVW